MLHSIHDFLSTKYRGGGIAMIPKILHYCWFGRGQPQDLFYKCLKSWQDYLPDWELKEWNEDNFDINMSPYTKFMYANREYAYVSDYVRLYALYTYGGFYLDTDVLLHNSLNLLLDNKLILSCEYITNNYKLNLNNAEIASISGHPLLLELMSSADNLIQPIEIDTELLTRTIFYDCS